MEPCQEKGWVKGGGEEYLVFWGIGIVWKFMGDKTNEALAGWISKQEPFSSFTNVVDFRLGDHTKLCAVDIQDEINIIHCHLHS